METQPVAQRAFEPVRAPARVLQVILEIALSANGLALARLVEQTGLPKTSLLSLLRSLEASNYVVNIGGSYRLGPEIYKVAAAVTAKERFLPVAQSVLQGLYKDTGETVQLSVLASDEPAAESVEVIETSKPIRLSFPTGLRRPLYCSSIGKLLLAYQEDAWTARYLANTPLIAYTPHTLTDKGKLLDELRQIRRTGLSISHQGMFEDASGLSSAVWNQEGKLVAGVSIVAPTYRMMRNEAGLQRMVLACGEDISRRLGYEGAYPPAVRQPENVESAG